jgi:hypothetical protein
MKQQPIYHNVCSDNITLTLNHKRKHSDLKSIKNFKKFINKIFIVLILNHLLQILIQEKFQHS